MKVNSLLNFFSTLDSFFANSYICLSIITCSFLLKFIFLFLLLKHWYKKTVAINYLYKLTILLVTSSLITDIAWIIKLLSLNQFFHLTYPFVVTFIRTAWIAFIIQYQLIGFLLEAILKKPLDIKFLLKVNAPNFAFLLTFFYILIFDRNINSISERFWLEPYLQELLMGYLAFIFIPLLVSNSLKKIKSIPLIVQRQFKIFLGFYVIPQVISDFIHINPFGSPNINSITESYTFVAISTILLNFMIYFCARHIIRLRFLNFKKQIEHTKLDYHFDEVFQKGLIELGSVTTLDQLGTHVQNFFFRLFGIPQKAITTHIHLSDKEKSNHNNFQGAVCQTLTLFHSHLQKDGEEIIFRYFHNHSIAIRHELEFNNFYNPNKQDTILLALLHNLDTDLIVPIVYKDSILGYISINDEEKNHYTLFTKSQQKATIIFASYLGTFAHILQNKRLETIETKAYAIEHQLFESNQRLTYYQEGIKTVLHDIQTTMVGLFIYHKNSIHPLHENIFNHYLNDQNFMQQCLQLVTQKSAPHANYHEKIIKIDKTTLHCSSIPLPHKNQFLIVIRNQNLATKIQSFAIQNPENAHSPCAFYILATKKGKLIDDYFPYATETFIHFKIKLMQLALNKKPIMLYGEKSDLKKIALFIHTLSEGINHHCFDAKNISPQSLLPILFGVQDLYEKSPTDKGLLEICNNGTLIMENIGYMPHHAQIDFAHFLSSGTYLPSKGFHTKTSTARIVILNAYDDFTLTQPHSINPNLEEILSQQTLYCPRLELLSEHEYIRLIEDIFEKNSSFNLSLEQRNVIMHTFLMKRPQSITEFEKTIDERLHQNQRKSYEKNYYEDTKESIEKIILHGKKSLQDPESMRILWNKFDKNQSYIASLLKVHRSSVNRRVKEYKL